MRTLFFAALAVLSACEAPDAELVASAELAVRNIPADVKCIHVIAEGAGRTVSKAFTVTGGAPGPMQFFKLPVGELTFNGSAYRVACANDADAPAGAVAAWLSEPVTATIHSGRPSGVTLDFWRNNPVDTGVDFHEAALAIARAGDVGLAVGANGKLYAWGDGSSGGLGNTRRDLNSPTPQAVPGIVSPDGAGGGNEHACAWKGADVWCWGLNEHGQLGLGTSDSAVHAPTLVPRPWSARVVALAGGFSHTCVLLANKQAYCWGANASGQLGVGNTLDRRSPTPVAQENENGSFSPDTEGFIALSAGGMHTCGVRPSGAVYCWGENGEGRGEGTVVVVPSYRAELTAFSAISAGWSHQCALRADGQVFCFGEGDLGQLGQGTRTSDEQIHDATTGVSDAVAIAAGGRHSCALKSDGTIACWGYDTTGALGDGIGSTTATAQPVRGISDAVAIAAGADNTCALRQNGELLCWGDNEAGQVGDGTVVTAFVPRHVELP